VVLITHWKVLEKAVV